MLHSAVTTEGNAIQLPRFIAARLDTKTYLGLHLTLTLIAASGAVWLFASLVDAVLDNATMVRWDMATDAAVHARSTPAGLTIFNWITRLGSPVSMSVLAAAIVIALMLQKRHTLAITVVAAMAGGGILERVLKSVIRRSRPEYGASYLHGTSFSFPSGHSMMSFICMAMLIYVLVAVGYLKSHGARAFAITIAAIAVLLVGVSRIYLGVHYPSDVLGGYAAGAAWVALCAGGAGVILHRRRHSVSS